MRDLISSKIKVDRTGIEYPQRKKLKEKNISERKDFHGTIYR